MPIDVASLSRIVEQSFCDVVRPDEEKMFDCYDPAIPDFIAMIKGKDWCGFLRVLETVEFSMAMLYGEMMVYMTDEAFHYFSPALLIFSMNEKSDVLSSLFFQRIDPSSAYFHSDHVLWQAFVGLFTGAQRQAVLLIMKYFYALDPVHFQYYNAVCDRWARTVAVNPTTAEADYDLSNLDGLPMDAPEGNG